MSVTEKGLLRVLTAGEVAQILKVDVQSVYGLLERGELHGTKVGGTWRVRPQDVDDFLSPSRVRETSPEDTQEHSEQNQQKPATTNLLFWTVLSSLIGSTLWAVTLVTFVWWRGSPYSTVWPRASSWLLLVSMLFLLAGLVGFRARRAAGSGRLARIGFWLTFAGLTLLILNLLFLITFWREAGASGFDPLGSIDSLGTSAEKITLWTAVVNLLAQPLFFGFLVLGVATVRAKVLPRWWRVMPLITACLVLLSYVSALLYYLKRGTEQGTLTYWVLAIVVTLCGLGFGLQGYALWRGAGDKLGNAIERRLEWLVQRLNRSAVFQTLEYAGRLTILTALILYIAGTPQRENLQQREAWQVINSALGQGGSGGRIEAMEGLAKDGESLVGVKAENAYLPEIDLEGAQLDSAIFRNADLPGANLRGASLWNANLYGAYLGESDSHQRKANLENADLSSSDLRTAQLPGANLRGATLVDAELFDADLTNAHLEDANLKNVVLEEATLQGAQLDSAVLKGAFFTDADILGADLRKVTGLTQDQVDAALGGKSTQLPKGLEKPDGWLQKYGELQVTGPLPPGEHSTKLFVPALSLTVPEGWEVDFAETRDYFEISPRDGDGYIAFHQLGNIYDPHTLGFETIEPAPDDIVKWYENHPYLDVQNKTPLPSVGGVSGTQLDIEVTNTPPQYPRDLCDGPCIPLHQFDDGAAYRVFPNSLYRFVVIQVQGETVIILYSRDYSFSQADNIMHTVKWEGEP